MSDSNSDSDLDEEIPIKVLATKKAKTTDENGNSKATKVTPEKPTRYFSYLLHDNTPVHFEDQAKAKEFLREFDSLVVKKRSFTVKRNFEKYKATLEAQSKFEAPATQTEPDRSNNQDMIDAKKMQDIVRDSQPVNRLQFWYKTTSTSTKAALIFSPLDTYNDQPWHMRLNFLYHPLKAYTKLRDVACQYTKETLDNLQLGTLSDPKDRNAPKQTSFTIKNGKTITRDQHAFYSYITLPLETLKSDTEEEEFLQDHLKVIGQNIINILASNLVRQYLINNARDTNSTFIEKALDRVKKTNMPKFLETATVHIQSINKTDERDANGEKIKSKIMNVLICKDANIILTHLYVTRQHEAKYNKELVADMTEDAKQAANSDKQETQEEQE